MTDKKELLQDDQDVIKETDIVFDCPHCNKSLAIDYRGAGLTIHCSDCGKEVQVPIPEGMELTDIDSSDEEQEIRILHLRKALSVSAVRIERLEAELEELEQRRDQLEKSRTDSLFVFGTISEQLESIDNAMASVTKAVQDIKEIIKKEKR